MSTLTLLSIICIRACFGPECRALTNYNHLLTPHRWACFSPRCWVATCWASFRLAPSLIGMGETGGQYILGQTRRKSASDLPFFSKPHTRSSPFTFTHTHRVILVGLLLASLSLAASGLVMSLALLLPPPGPALTALAPSMTSSGLSLVALAASRVAFGFFSAAAMPAVSAMAAELVPQQYRSSATAAIYAVFNLGGTLIPCRWQGSGGRWCSLIFKDPYLPPTPF